MNNMGRTWKDAKEMAKTSSAWGEFVGGLSSTGRYKAAEEEIHKKL